MTDFDSTVGNTDTIQLAADVLPSDVTLRRSGDDLVLTIPDTGDRLTVTSWFVNESPVNQAERIAFADGTTWDVATIQDLVRQGTAGDDTLVGTVAADTLSGLGGNDLLDGRAGDDTLDGGTGNDTLTGGSGNDTYLFGRGSGQDTILDQDATPGNLDTIQMGAGIAPSDLTARRTATDLVFTVNGTTDSLRVQNWLSPDFLVEQVQFADGTVWDQAFIRSIVSQPTDSDDFLVGTPERDALDGGGGNDLLDGQGENDLLVGGTGDDTLLGGEGDDVLDGGPGQDVLDGGSGRDTYHINHGGGWEIIQDESVFLDERQGTLVFGEGITPDSISVQASGGYLAIGIGNDEGALLEGVEFGGEGEVGGGSPSARIFPIERFLFADGRELSLDDMLAKTDGGVVGMQFGTAAGDLLRGSVAQDFIEGFEGDDHIDARGNSDSVSGGDGDDVVGAGTGADTVFGGSGDDILAGGLGDDVLRGDNGNDVYAFNRGDGADRVFDDAGAPGSADLDMLSFGHGIAPQDIRAYVESSGQLVLLTGGGDSVSVPWFDAASGFAPIDAQRIERAQFFDGTSARIFDLAGVVGSLTGALLAADADHPVPLFTEATAGFELTGDVESAGGVYAASYAATGDLFAAGQVFIDGDADDVIAIGAGDDTIDAGEGNNVVNAGDGNNLVTSGAGNDAIIAGSGDDVITAGDGDNVIQAGGGNNVVTAGAGADRITTGAGQDVLSAGAGDDALSGGAGDDTYVFNLGDAVDTVQDAAAPGEGNSIQFGDGITPADLKLAVDQNVLVIQVGGGGDALRFENFDPADPVGPHSVETFRFADGTVLTYSQLLARGFDFIGTQGDDVLLGTAAADRIVGMGGDDVIAVGTGNDVLDGGSGNDTYVFNLGDGVDTIMDGTAPGAGNVVQFGPGITSADISLRIGQNTLVLTVGTSGDAIRFSNFDSASMDGPHPVETFKFSDGGTLSFSQLLARGFVFTGTSANDTLIGTSARDTFNGLTGNDTLTGGSGDDTYMFNLGDGIDSIDDRAEIGEGNTLSFGPGITSADLRLSVDEQREMLIVNVGTGGDALRLTNFDPGNVAGPNAIEFYSFADGTTKTYGQLIERGFDLAGTEGDDFLTGTNANDRIQGVDGNDMLAGGAGDDVLTGGLGDTTYLFNLGDGVDVIDDLATADTGNTLVFGDGITPDDLVLSPGVGELVIKVGNGGDAVRLTNFDPTNADAGPHAIETFQFADGTVLTYQQIVARTFIVQGDFQDNVVVGTNVSDRLYGYEGSDLLDGGLGNDTLTGGTGNDMLIGGTGSNTYIVNLGDGQDTVHDVAISDAGNQILFGAGITQADLAFTQDQNTLTIAYGTEGDAIILEDFDPSGANGSLVVSTLQFADGNSVNMADLFPPSRNTAPTVANALADQTINEDASFTFQVPANTFADQDAGDTQMLSASLANGDPLPAWLGFDVATGTFSGMPGNSEVGSVNVTVTATDSGNLSATDTFALTVANVNDAPTVANGIADQSTAEGSPFAFQVPANAFADVDVGETLTYSALQADGNPLPAWLIFDGTTNTLTGTPDEADIGTVSLTVTAADSGNLSVADTFALTVTVAPDLVRVGTEGDDVIAGRGGNDQLWGLAGNDVLKGKAGNDTITGGTGNDILDGGAGDDTYVYHLGDGLDRIEDAVGLDTLSFGAGLTFDHTVVRLADAAGAPVARLRLLDEHGSELPDQGLDIPLEATGVSPIERVAFADGTSFDLSDLVIRTQVTEGTRRGEVIRTGRHDDIIYGGKGGDTISAGSGHDTVHAGKGGDRVYGEAGNDALYGNKGKDVLDGGYGDDLLDGNKGEDILRGGPGNDRLLGGKGEDVLEGGPGDDLLDSGEGHDTILFGRGDGQDTLIGGESNRHDKVRFGTDIEPLDLILSRQAEDLRVALYGSTDRFTIRDWHADRHNRPDAFVAGNGQQLLHTKVDQLIQAMASFSDQSSLAWEQAVAQRPQEVQHILAASWQ